ncbi:MAG: Xylulokinase [Acetothermia bacterium 64_32]|nr:MAG: Xylulokinase [Acetothermia bacterium 64_32]HAF70199.1 xylulokinase [Candidatus Acetothermia bacterium]
MAEGLLLGLDIGTGGAKGILVSLEGEVVARATASYPLHTPRPGWAEQDPRDWWEASLKVLRELFQKAQGEILGIGLTGQMHGAVFLDGKLQVLRPAILWNDARTGEECREIKELVGKERLKRIAGNPALAGFQAPKILWLRKNEPENYARVRHILLPKDYIRFKLTGELATDASDAAGTLLLDLKKRDWSEEILSALSIPREWLPKVYEGPEITGTVTAEAESLTGISKGTPVVAGGGDNAASAVGVGVVEEGTGLLSLGTSGVIFVHTEVPRPDPKGAIHCFCHAVPGKYHLMGVVLSAGGSLQWYRDKLSSEEKEVAERIGMDPYEILTKEAERIPPGADGLLFLPYLSGERTPHMDPEARGAWVGLSFAHGKGHLVRAVLEGVAFALKDSWVRIQRLGESPPELRAVGGGMQSPLWRRIMASVLGVPLRRLVVEEGAAYGAALLSGVGAGVYRDVHEAVKRAVRLREEREEPHRALSSLYAGLYERYVRLYPALKEAGIF